MKDSEKAEDLYRRAIQVNGRHAYALFNLAILLEEKAQDNIQIKEVRQLLQRAVQSSPGILIVTTLLEFVIILLSDRRQQHYYIRIVVWGSKALSRMNCIHILFFVNRSIF